MSFSLDIDLFNEDLQRPVSFFLTVYHLQAVSEPIVMEKETNMKPYYKIRWYTLQKNEANA